jgi:hypothetical protein
MTGNPVLSVSVPAAPVKVLQEYDKYRISGTIIASNNASSASQ